jgi:low affinity Fe/Cu permease
LNIINELKKAERKLEKQVHHAGAELTKIRNAIIALGHKVERNIAKPMKRKQHAQSAKTRRKIAAAQKARWAKIRAGKKAS